VEHGKPLVFGPQGERGLRLKPGTLALEVVPVGKGGVPLEEILVHDETNRTLAQLLVGLEPPEFPMALGVLYCAPATSYEADVYAQGAGRGLRRKARPGRPRDAAHPRRDVDGRVRPVLLPFLLGLSLLAGDGRWSTAASLPEPIQELSAAVLHGKIYVAGGIDRRGRPTAAAFRYDPAANRWERIADLPAPRHHMPLAVVGDTLYAVGGLAEQSFVPEATLWLYREDHKPLGPAGPASRAARGLRRRNSQRQARRRGRLERRAQADPSDGDL